MEAEISDPANVVDVSEIGGCAEVIVNLKVVSSMARL